MVEWTIGEYCDKLETKYGEQTIQKFAEAIGREYKTVLQHRTTYRSWKTEISRPREISVAQELRTLPSEKKKEIMETQPNITYTEAREKVKEYKNDLFMANNPIVKLNTVSIIEYKEQIKGNLELEFEEMQNDFITESPRIRNLLNDIATLLSDNENFELTEGFKMAVQMLRSKMMFLVRSNSGEKR
jgi:hypothetical protein